MHRKTCSVAFTIAAACCLPFLLAMVVLPRVFHLIGSDIGPYVGAALLGCYAFVAGMLFGADR